MATIGMSSTAISGKVNGYNLSRYNGGHSWQCWHGKSVWVDKAFHSWHGKSGVDKAIRMVKGMSEEDGRVSFGFSFCFSIALGNDCWGWGRPPKCVRTSRCTPVSWEFVGVGVNGLRMRKMDNGCGCMRSEEKLLRIGLS